MKPVIAHGYRAEELALIRRSSAEALGKLSTRGSDVQAVHRDEETGQTIDRRHGGAAPGEFWWIGCCASSACRQTSVAPQVAYREAITRAVARAKGRFVRQTGGTRPIRPRRRLEIEPLPPEEGTEVRVLSTVSVARQDSASEYIPSVEQGDSRSDGVNGPLAGYEMEGVRAAVV